MSPLLPFEKAMAAGLGPWPGGTLFLAAVSGGADSTAMLASLETLRRGGDFRLHCLHVEHGIRPPVESRGDAEAVQALCKAWDIPCRVITIPPGKIAAVARTRRLGIEEAARLFRHAAWNREAQRLGAERVLVAHTRDDLLETLLMRILRGSGPAGLAAMPRGRGRVLRPLLDFSRTEVLAYLAERGIPYRVDSTNADPAFLRNRIRSKLIPCLDEFFPSWKQSLAALGETQRLTADFLAAASASRIPWRPLPAGPGGGTARQTPAEAFFSAPEILREEALFATLDRGGGGSVGPDGLRKSAPPRRRSLRLFTRGECAVLDLGSHRIERRGDRVILSPRGIPGGEAGFSLVIKKPGSYKLRGIRIQTGAGPVPPGGEVFFAVLPLVLRNVLASDYIERDGRHFSASKALDRSFLSGYTDTISAEDFCGVAAFIGFRGEKAALLFSRAEKPKEGAETPFPFYIVSGGTHVQ
jgi:tRNA(Ile)-lysidine synthase